MRLQHFTILILILSRTKAAAKSQVVQSLPGCSDRCGNITIPYPFGIEEGCYLYKEYQVNCTTLRFFAAQFKLLDISLDGFIRGVLPITYACYNTTYQLSGSDSWIWTDKFLVSGEKNVLTTVGCDARADIMSMDTELSLAIGTTRSKCNRLYDGLCFGYGCNQVPLFKSISKFRIRSQTNTGKLGRWSFNNCSYAFIVQKDQYTFYEKDFDNMLNRSFPVVLEWTVGRDKCKYSQKNTTKYICKENSVCIDAAYDGYNCRCAQGYEGNAYLPNGCQDINECENEALNDCIYGCVNTNGSYNCSCPFGQSGDGREHGNGCSNLEVSKSPGKPIYIGIIMGIVASAILTLILYSGFKHRRIMKSREMFFKKNGGLILQKILFESKQSSHLAKIFTSTVLEKATNNFHKSNVIGQGGYGTVYKGTLENKITVAIKKAKSIDNNQIEQFINEVVMLSEISHPNIVKLLGCCLETQTPLLVYEFVSNNNVFHHLHEMDQASSMSFERRLNIARQTAEAIAHIHSTTQIIHRDIKSSNILLTDDYTAKVSDFGISRFIPVDQTHVQTLVHGTLGYIDPEYFRSGMLTEKSDVYSFGMVLVELLTGRKVFSNDGTESDLGLAMFFVLSLERGGLLQILDDQVKKGGVDEHIKYFAKLAKDCIELEGKKRPNMKTVKEELDQLRQSFIEISLCEA
ncbi:hypothetical protein QVD17_38353 [Tagetes erecta]|uniref:Protein kinase domain-containing protein n=1 Tax=Tagetes erecta TaxID=13708 RepID=A0AAD8JLK9_TARER|nr:hypothetical protein QVD17_38353 [Tagetes erecta]